MQRIGRIVQVKVQRLFFAAHLRVPGARRAVSPGTLACSVHEQCTVGRVRTLRSMRCGSCEGMPDSWPCCRHETHTNHALSFAYELWMLWSGKNKKWNTQWTNQIPTSSIRSYNRNVEPKCVDAPRKVGCWTELNWTDGRYKTIRTERSGASDGCLWARERAA